MTRDFPIRTPQWNRRSRSGKVAPLVILCIATGIGVAIMTILLGPPPVQNHPWVSHTVPSVELQPLVNTDQPLNLSDLEGKVTVVNFWGPWCPPCIMEFPDLLKVRETFAQEEDFQFVSITAGYEMVEDLSGPHEDTDKLFEQSKQLLADHQTDLPVYVDYQAKLRGELNAISDFTGYPTTILIGRDGKISAVWLGYTPSLKDELTNIVHEKLTSS